MTARSPHASLLGLALLLGACAHSPTYDPADPLESINRPIYRFNEVLDDYVAQPVAKVYVAVTPRPVQIGVTNFFDNLTYPTVILNDLLQAKFRQAGADTARFTVNTFAGFVGVLDVATHVGLPAHNEDFGQTLGHWGVGQGWYLMLPILGPATNRDFVGRIGDAYTYPPNYAEAEVAFGLGLLNAVQVRASLLGTESILDQQFDRYAFVRSLYLQRRESLVHDGNPPPEDFGFEE